MTKCKLGGSAGRTPRAIRQIEDRTENAPGTPWAGSYVVWEVVLRPRSVPPRRIYCGHYDSLDKAQRAAGTMLRY